MSTIITSIIGVVRLHNNSFKSEHHSMYTPMKEFVLITDKDTTNVYINIEDEKFTYFSDSSNDHTKSFEDYTIHLNHSFNYISNEYDRLIGDKWTLGYSLPKRNDVDHLYLTKKYSDIILKLDTNITKKWNIIK